MLSLFVYLVWYRHYWGYSDGIVGNGAIEGMYYAKNLKRNIISHDMLDAKGYGNLYRGEQRVIASLNRGLSVLNVQITKSALVVRTEVERANPEPTDNSRRY